MSVATAEKANVEYLAGNKTQALVEEQQFVLARLGTQLFGIDVMLVQDALNPIPITPLPLAPPIIAGTLNLRGHIVTAFDLHYCLGLSPRKPCSERPGLVIQWRDERLYNLLVDETTEVLTMPKDQFEANPPNLGEHWNRYSQGIYRLEKELMIVLDVDAVLNI